MENTIFNALAATETLRRPVDSPEALPATSWRDGLPSLNLPGFTLRELQPQDAVALHACLATPEMCRYSSTPPETPAGFRRFVDWAHAERFSGRYVCYAVVPDGAESPVGLFQLRALDGCWSSAEWGFALSADRWGTGLFEQAAGRVLEFAFDLIGVRRLEARVAVRNGRGIGALAKLGAVQECVLRRSLVREGERLDQALYAILADEWRVARRHGMLMSRLVH